MIPVTVRSFISAPREPIFDCVADLATRVSFADHYMKDFHLARAKTTGMGAAATFRLEAPFFHGWGELWIEKLERPWRLLEHGRFARVGRSHMWSVYEFWAEGPELTRVELTSWSEPATKVDALREAVGMRRRWQKRQNKTALHRLRQLFEQAPHEPPARATIAGFEPHKAPRFGASVPRAG